MKYQLIADKLSQELIDCAIGYFNNYRDTKIDPGDDALKLAKYASKIAIGSQIRDKLINIPTIEEYVKEKPKRKKIKNQF